MNELEFLTGFNIASRVLRAKKEMRDLKDALGDKYSEYSQHWREYISDERFKKGVIAALNGEHVELKEDMNEWYSSLN